MVKAFLLNIGMCPNHELWTLYPKVVNAYGCAARGHQSWNLGIQIYINGTSF